MIDEKKARVKDTILTYIKMGMGSELSARVAGVNRAKLMFMVKSDAGFAKKILSLIKE